MNQKRELPLDAADLLDRLDVGLEGLRGARDLRTTPRVALGFCEMLLDELDEDQRAAVETARLHWAGRTNGQVPEFVARFAERIDSDQRNGASRRDAAVNRLVWTALNENTEFSGYAAEFLVGLGEGAGLSARRMSEVFRNEVPFLGW